MFGYEAEVWEKDDDPCPFCGADQLFFVDDADAEAFYDGGTFYCKSCKRSFHNIDEIGDEEFDDFDDFDD